MDASYGVFRFKEKAMEHIDKCMSQLVSTYHKLDRALKNHRLEVATIDPMFSNINDTLILAIQQMTILYHRISEFVGIYIAFDMTDRKEQHGAFLSDLWSKVRNGQRITDADYKKLSEM